MELKCPHCGETIPAENINIHETLAVCSHCNHVFNFGGSIPARKGKKRAVQQPERLQERDSDAGLTLSYSRVYRPDDQGGIGGSAVLFVVMVATWIGAALGNGPPMVLLVLALLALGAAYTFFALVLHRVQIDLRDDALTVRHGPLPLPTIENLGLSTDEIVRVFADETVESREKGSLNQRYYHVCAELTNGNRVVLLKALPHDYAVYIAQRLDGYWLEDEAPETALDTGDVDDDTEDMSALSEADESGLRKRADQGF